MSTHISQEFDELEISPNMAHTQAGRRGQNGVATSLSLRSIPGDPELTYELESTDLPNVPTTNIQSSLDSTSLIFKNIKVHGRKLVEFSGREDFTVSFTNRTRKRLTCTCANAAPCSVSSIRCHPRSNNL